MNKIKKEIQIFFKYNIQFVSYVILSVVCAATIRGITVKNILSIKPLVFDIAIPILIGSFVYLTKPKKQFKYLLTLLIIEAITCIINSVYYSWYSSFASFSLLTCLGQAGEVTNTIVLLLKPIHFIYVIPIIVFIFIHNKLNKKDYFNLVTKYEKGKLLFKKVFITSSLILLVGILTLSSTAFSRLNKQWNREYIVSRFGIIIYQTNDLFNTLKPQISSMFGFDVANKEFNEYYEKNTISKSNNEWTNKYEGYNVIFVHMESLTSFLIDLEINDTKIAPNLSKLSKEGIYFSNFYPQISVGTSSDTEFTLNTSLMPSSSGTVFVSYYDRDYVTIPKLLKAKGYYTFSMHGNKASMWNRDNMHPSLGYMDFYSSTSFTMDENVGLGISDHSFFKQAIPILETIEANNEKYMGTIITLSNHTPFDNNLDYFEQIDLKSHYKKYNNLTKKYENLEFDYLEGTTLGKYLRSAHYADMALGEFIDMINKSSAFNKTLFVFYGDHDPKLSKDEFNYYYNFNKETGELYTIDDEEYVNYDYFSNELNRNTPLILWTKNNKIARKYDYYMGMIDVMPTVGNMLGIYNEYALGHDIFEIKNNNIISFPNGDFLTNKIYYRSSNETYKILKNNFILKEDYLEECKDYVELQMSVSNDIIVHDLIKYKKEGIPYEK